MFPFPFPPLPPFLIGFSVVVVPLNFINAATLRRLVLVSQYFGRIFLCVAAATTAEARPTRRVKAA